MLNFDKMAASLLAKIPKKMYNNIEKSSPLMKAFLKKGKVWDSGGDTIQPHIKYKEADNRGSYNGYDTLNITPQDTRTAAEFRLKQLYASIVFNGYEEAADKGELAVHKLVATAVEDAESSIKDLFAQQVFGDGTGNAGKDLTGLKAYIDDGTSVAVYGGIDRATNAFWKSNVGTFALDGSDLVAKMKEMYAKCARGGMENKPDLIVTDLATWLEISNKIDEKSQLAHGTGKLAQEFANLGFIHQSFFGVPIVYDEYCPADTIYFINSNTFQLHSKPGRKFQPSELVKPKDQDAKIGQIFFAGELVGTEPRANGVLTRAAV